MNNTQSFILTIIFAFVSAIVICILFADVFGYVKIGTAEFLSVSAIGLLNAIVYSEIIFKKPKDDEGD